MQLDEKDLEVAPEERRSQVDETTARYAIARPTEQDSLREPRCRTAWRACRFPTPVYRSYDRAMLSMAGRNDAASSSAASSAAPNTSGAPAQPGAASDSALLHSSFQQNCSAHAMMLHPTRRRQHGRRRVKPGRRILSIIFYSVSAGRVTTTSTASAAIGVSRAPHEHEQRDGICQQHGCQCRLVPAALRRSKPGRRRLSSWLPTKQYAA